MLSTAVSATAPEYDQDNAFPDGTSDQEVERDRRPQDPGADHGIIDSNPKTTPQNSGA
jgi:hypothetical protein